MISIRNIFTVKTFLKIICSIPVLLVVLYFLPPLGIFMLIGRYFVYDSRHYYRAPISLFIIGAIILIPRGLELLNSNFNLSLSIPNFNYIVQPETYQKFVDFAKSLIIISVIFLVVSYILKFIANKISGTIGQVLKAYFSKEMETEAKIRQENDLKLKEKAIESKQKTPHVVKCPNCGKANSIVGTVGKCKACRNHIEYKGKL